MLKAFVDTARVLAPRVLGGTAVTSPVVQAARGVALRGAAVSLGANIPRWHALAGQRRLLNTTPQPGSPYVRAASCVPPLAPLRGDELQIPCDSGADLVAKTVIFTDTPAKRYTYTPGTDTFQNQGTAVGHAFVAVQPRDGGRVDVFEHRPGAPRSSYEQMTSLPLPAAFGELPVAVSLPGSLQPQSMSNKEFLALSSDHGLSEGVFRACTHEAAPPRDLNALVQEAVMHNVIVGFEQPLTAQQYEALRQARLRLQREGYHPRHSNCSRYPRALFQASVTPTAVLRTGCEHWGPHLWYDIAAYEGLVQAAQGLSTPGGQPLVQQHRFNGGDAQDLRAFLGAPATPAGSGSRTGTGPAGVDPFEDDGFAAPC